MTVVAKAAMLAVVMADVLVGSWGCGTVDWSAVVKVES